MASQNGTTDIPIEGRLFINNECIPSSHPQTLSVSNPYTDTLITSSIQIAGPVEVDQAVTAASAAFKTWRFTPTAQRSTIMLKAADLLEQHAESIAKLESICMGAPMMLAKSVAGSLATSFRYYAGLVDKIKGEVYAEDGDGFFKIVNHEPLGVCAGIAGWNATPIFAGNKIAAAVAAGNTVIFKASEKSPLGALYLGKLFKEAGFPPGVINLISGGAETGTLLASHMRIAHISFTGSRNVGRKVQVAAANSNLKHVTLELGGKSAAIVFDDAQLQNAITHNSQSFLMNSGQVCCAGSRVLVQEGIAEQFVQGLKVAFEQLTATMGDPSAPTTFIGPLVDGGQSARVREYVKGAETAGLSAVVGGTLYNSEGNFVMPTIFLNPADDSKVYTEEIFGPVLTVKTFKTEDQAIEMANSSSFGLAATIFTSNMQRALRMTPRLEAGMISINSAHFPLKQMPWGGWKESGYGRESGLEGLKEYLQSKTVQISTQVPE